MSTFNDYLTAKNLKPKTVKAYAREAEKFLQWLEQEHLTLNQVDYKTLLQLIRQNRAAGRNRQEVNKQLRGARLYFNYLIEAGKATDNPVSGLYVKGDRRRLPHDLMEWEDLENVYQSYEATNPITQRNKTLLGLLIYQALTLEDIEHLEAEHLKLREGKIIIPGNPRRNGRTLHLEASQILELQEYQLVTREKLLNQARTTHFASAKRPIHSLFFGAGGGKMEASLWYFLRAWDPPLKAVSIRSSVIAHWLKTKDIRVVQYMAGHKYASSTERYRQVRLEDLQEELKKFHPLNQPSP